MKRREGYKGYVIVARSHELQAEGFSAEFSIEEHDADGVIGNRVLLAQRIPDAGVGYRSRYSGWAAEDRRGS